ncbi:hypothetical protein ACWEOE_31780 [Amycolatopsis sp. NPDC004368]
MSDQTATLHDAIAIGINRGLHDLGADIHGCTPPMLTGHVIQQLRVSGLHPSSPVPSPAEGGNASERPNAGQHGDLYAESTDTVYVHDSVTGYWTGFARTDGEDLDQEKLPDDAVPLHGHRDEDARQHLRNVGAQRDVEKRRADTAEAAERIASMQRDRIAAERDEALAKLDEIRDAVAEVLVDAGDHYQDNDDCIEGCPACALANVRKIVNPGATRG